MKNITKKFSAIALACTLLVTGNTIAQKTNYETKAHAATCTHYNWRRYANYSEWEIYDRDYNFNWMTGNSYVVGYFVKRNKYIKCVGCTRTVQTVVEYSYKPSSWWYK